MIENMAMAVVHGPTLVNSGGAEAVGTDYRLTIPGGFFYPGRALQFSGSGFVTCGGSPNSLGFQVTDATGTVVVFSPGTVTLRDNVAMVPWSFGLLLVCRTAGSGTATTFFSTAWMASEALPGGGSGVSSFINFPAGTPAAQGTLDSAAEFSSRFRIQCGLNTTVVVSNYSVDLAN